MPSRCLCSRSGSVAAAHVRVWGARPAARPPRPSLWAAVPDFWETERQEGQHGLPGQSCASLPALRPAIRPSVHPSIRASERCERGVPEVGPRLRVKSFSVSESDFFYGFGINLSVLFTHLCDVTWL